MGQLEHLRTFAKQVVDLDDQCNALAATNGGTPMLWHLEQERDKVAKLAMEARELLKGAPG